jgi:SAM-dependent methyltransferase
MSDDRYAKFDYSRVINWNERLQREWPLLDEVLRSAPSKRILDLGSGTGEHARFLASKGFEVTGVDLSQSMLEKSLAVPSPNVRFVEGDMRDIANLARGATFGGAICLGNALPHLTEDEDLRRLFGGLRKVLDGGAPFVLQILNYDRIEAKRERALPLTFHRDPDDPQATIVFLRTMELLPDGRAIFMPSTIRQRPDREPPMELVASRRVEIRAWRRAQIEELLRQNGFGSVTLFGSYARDPFEPSESRDLIAVAKD